jgi:hypothetical protein
MAENIINETDKKKKNLNYIKSNKHKLTKDFFKNLIEHENKLQREYTKENVSILVDIFKKAIDYYVDKGDNIRVKDYMDKLKDLFYNPKTLKLFKKEILNNTKNINEINIHNFFIKKEENNKYKQNNLNIKPEIILKQNQDYINNNRLLLERTMLKQNIQIKKLKLEHSQINNSVQNHINNYFTDSIKIKENITNQISKQTTQFKEKLNKKKQEKAENMLSCTPITPIKQHFSTPVKKRESYMARSSRKSTLKLYLRPSRKDFKNLVNQFVSKFYYTYRAAILDSTEEISDLLNDNFKDKLNLILSYHDQIKELELLREEDNTETNINTLTNMINGLELEKSKIIDKKESILMIKIKEIIDNERKELNESSNIYCNTEDFMRNISAIFV